MQLKQIASLLVGSHLIGDQETIITGVQMDSRKVQQGDLFVAVSGIAGHMNDGHPYVMDAIRRGASAVVLERDVAGVEIPRLLVKDSRHALAVISSAYYNYPSHELKVIGITGTNGKTTTAYLVEKILRDYGFRTGLMGNLGMKLGDGFFAYEGNTNTQESPDLQRNFRKMCEVGTDYCVMEVTSVGIEYGRASGVNFRSAAFTNLSTDHLDLHETMDNYKMVKGLLFSRLGNSFGASPDERKYAIINVDDATADYYIKQTYAETITYGIDKQADVRAEQIKITPSGTSFDVRTFAGNTSITLKLLGKFNVYNALAAIAIALAEGISLESIKTSLESMAIVEGRMEVVNEGQQFLVIVDYAHTPDGLENALSTTKDFAPARIICVFGCGGNRDRTKRPIMGKVAAEYCDKIIITSDNPRHEDPLQIMKDIEEGLLDCGCDQARYELVADRSQAIEKAIEWAQPNDIVMIIGKGHETYQLIQGKTLPFDDREVARSAIRRRKL